MKSRRAISSVSNAVLGAMLICLCTSCQTLSRHSALCSAVVGGDIETIGQLLGDGVDPNRPNADGDTPLHLCPFDSENGPQVLRLLLSHDANVNVADRYGNTPLMVLFKTLDSFDDEPVEQILLLLDHGAMPDIPDKAGVTPLMQASLGNKSKSAAALLAAGASPNIATPHGNTALTFAAMAGSNEFISVLLENGADPTVRNSEGKSALDYARDNCNDSTVKKLALRQHSTRSRLSGGHNDHP